MTDGSKSFLGLFIHENSLKTFIEHFLAVACMIELFVNNCFRFQLTACTQAVLGYDGKTKLWRHIWYENISK